MAVQSLGLFDLLNPQYLAGFQFPDYIHQYLSILSVREMQTYYDDFSVVYSGRSRFGNDETDTTQVEHNAPDGTGLSWNRENIFFRLTIPRDGAQFIDDAVSATPSGSSSRLASTKTLLDDLKPVEEAVGTTEVATEYPAVQFTLEILIDTVDFTLGTDWIPGQVHPTTHRVIPDTDPAVVNKRIKISLPQVKLVYTQGDDATNLNPVFRIDSWGMEGMDGASDLATGDLVKMEPSIALHTSRHVAFSINKIIIDLSKNSTPPEIKDHFGIDDDWTGIYIQQLLFYYSNDQGVGFNIRVKEALISFAGEVSLEAALDVYPKLDITILSADSTFYNGQDRVTGVVHGITDPPVETPPADAPGGSVSIKQNGVMHLEVSGGRPPYTISVLQDSTEIWDAGSRSATFTTLGDSNVFIKVTDVNHLLFSEYIKVTVTANTDAPPSGTSADRPPSSDPLQTLDALVQSGNDAEHYLSQRESGSRVYLSVRGGAAFSIQVTPHSGGAAVINSHDREVSLDVPNDSTFDITVAYDNIPATTYPDQEVHFAYDKPWTDGEINQYVTESCSDDIFLGSFHALNQPNASSFGDITLDGFASNDPSNAAHDQTLSANRVSVIQQKLQSLYPSKTISVHAHGHLATDGTTLPAGDPSYREVIIHFNNVSDIAATTITGTIHRPAAPAPGPTPPSATTGTQPPAAPQLPNNLPPVLTQLGIRVKIERNDLSLLELSGEIDIQTELERTTRTGVTDHGDTAPADQHLDLHRADHDPSNANDSKDGLIDFVLGYQYDKALSETTLTLHLFSGVGDTDGLLHMDNNAARDESLKNILGAVLLFAPIINAAATATANNSSDAGAWVALGASIAVPVAIGALNVFRTRKIILFGAEIKTKFTVPDATNPNYSIDVGIVFDYEVQFDIVCEQLGIGLDRLGTASPPLPPPLRARYKAIGFNIHYQEVDGHSGLDYIPVFDSSKGYDLDLSDPSLFRLPDPLGQLFNIAGARLARFNPLTLEIDFAIKVDLGVITVDRFKLKIPLDPVGAPQIIPSGIRVNIPGVLIGNGFVEIKDTDIQQQDGTTIHAKGIEGGLDLTIVAIKIRISASIGVMSISDNITHRQAIAVFLGLQVQFPTPIILGQTGLGIFGFSGLFAMHYKRLEDPPVPTDSVGPALKWLIKAQGQPQHLKNTANESLWGPDFDHWAFGVGVLLGTVDGVLLNFQGMFILELPGPRILIMIKVRIVQALPSISDTAQLEVGIIGVIDIDFDRMQITLGVMISFVIQEFLEISLPVEIFFKLDNPTNWHLYVGTISQPASSRILNIVRGSAYLMIQGNELDYSAYGSNVPQFLQDKVLNGIAIAVGIEASITLGDEGAGIYLRLAAGVHLGISFSPFLAVGVLHFTGELKLIVVSIGAHGEFDVLISKIPGSNSYKTYLHGEVCGSIDLFFFSISACVSITISDDHFDLEPAKLVRGVYLQSFSPVLTSGQGGTRPIDASLGNALELNHGDAIADPSKLLIVPIDSIIVLQLQASPKLTGGTSFPMNGSLTIAPGQSPDIRMDNTETDAAGWIKLSDDVKIRYILNTVTFTEGAVNYAGDVPPAVWRIDKPANSTGSDTSIDLALFSRVPTNSDHALERSTDLLQNLTVRWQNACKTAAPPASVLYTFCSQPFGPSVNGWLLKGIPQPDPVGTIRISPVNTTMHVFQPKTNDTISTLAILLAELGISYDVPAQVVGVDNFNLPSSPANNKNCYKVGKNIKAIQEKQIIVQDALKIYSVAGKPPVLNAHLDMPVLPGYIEIDLLKQAANTVTIYFTAPAKDNTLTAVAYNSKREAVDQATYKPADKILRFYTLQLTGDDIKSVHFITGNYAGVIVQVCIEVKTGANTGNTDYACYRALQLPYENSIQNNPKQLDQYRDQVNEYSKKRQHYNYVVFETGKCESVYFYGAVYSKLVGAVKVQELNAVESILKEYALTDLSPVIVTSPTNLPADWISPASPWHGQVLSESSFLFSARFNNYEKILFQVKPQSSDCVKICISTDDIQNPSPNMYIAAVECLQTSEIIQQEIVQGILETEQNTLANYLNGNSLVPLLKPDTVYRVSVNYTIEQHNTKSGNSSQVIDQDFVFKTDQEAPKQLSPYVLGALPDMDDKFHFYSDDLKVVLNDDAVIKMYQAYGKNIKAVIRGADGAPITNSPDTTVTLQDVPASVLTPYRETIQSMIDAGLLPCLGSATFPVHSLYTAPFILKPLMSYTFDLELDPETLVADTDAKTPLYRGAFTTSKYADLADFTGDISKQSIRHKALTAILSLPAATGAESAPPVFTVTDVEMENALTAAGIAYDVTKEQTGFTILWSNHSGDFVPYSILIEAAEPLWRSRVEAVSTQVLNPQNQVIDHAFVIYENQPVEAMKLVPDAGAALLSHFVKTTAGTKTVVMLKDTTWTDVPQPFIIKAVQTASTFYNSIEKSEVLFNLNLSSKAPWEE